MKIIMILVLLSSYLFAFDKVSLSYGFHNGDDIEAIDLSATKNLSFSLFDTFDSSIELNYTDFKYNTNQNLYILALTPTLTYDLNNNMYIDMGIGASYISNTEFEDERMGINFQFRNFVGLVYKINTNFSVQLRYVHYSNAYIDEDNSGLDMSTIGLSYSF